MQGKLAARLDREPEWLWSLHPLQADTPVPFGSEHGQQGGLTGRLGQPPQRPDRDRPQVGDRTCALTEGQSAEPEAEAPGLLVLADVAEAPEGGENPVHGRHWQIQSARDVGRAPLGPLLGEDLQDAESPLEHLEGRLLLGVVLASPGGSLRCDRAHRLLPQRSSAPAPGARPVG